jgi:hypothetical protein
LPEEKLFGVVPQPERPRPSREGIVSGIEQEANGVPDEPQNYNPTEFMHRLALQKLGKDDYTAPEYQAALEWAATEFPDAAAQARPGWPQTGPDTAGQELVDRAKQALREQGIHEPTVQQMRDALIDAQTDAQPEESA